MSFLQIDTYFGEYFKVGILYFILSSTCFNYSFHVWVFCNKPLTDLIPIISKLLFELFFSSRSFCFLCYILFKLRYTHDRWWSSYNLYWKLYFSNVSAIISSSDFDCGLVYLNKRSLQAMLFEKQSLDFKLLIKISSYISFFYYKYWKI